MAVEFFLVSPFFGYDIVFAIIFAIVSLALAIFALRISKVTSQSSTELFGIGFLLISLSYFSDSIFNFIMLPQLSSTTVPTMIKLSFLTRLEFLGAYAHIFFMLSGLVILLYMTFDIKNRKVLAALLLLILLPILLSDDAFVLFYLAASTCLIFIAYYYIKNYFKHRYVTSLVTAVAFVLILFANIQLIFSSSDQFFYVLGHLLELVAYILIFVNFYLVLKR